MIRRRAVVGILFTGLLVIAFGGQPVAAAPPEPVDGGNEIEWRQLYETTGLSWNQVAGVCPRDGETPCSGSIGTKVLTGWVWATDAQLVELMGTFEPAILTADPPAVSGPEYFLTAAGFLGQMRWTVDITSTYSHHEAAIGWTSSTDDAGAPIGGAVALGFPPASGSFAVRTGDAATDASQNRGVWLWRPSGLDHTPPVITPIVGGTQGNNGWFVSDVSVDWDVHDDGSAISHRIGCDPAAVTSDTSGSSFSCEATSAGGTAAESAVVRRDTTAPTLTCGTPEPVFQIYQVGARVSASVTDATSGPAASTAHAGANTSRAGSFTVSVTGTDRAGHAGRASCPYKVVIPTCRGLTATRVGTASNDLITGTVGNDVIVALGGADTVNAGGGADVICGGDGGDTLRGDAGNDWIDGEASPDDIFGGAGNDTLFGGLHNDSLRGEGGPDTCASGEIRMSSCEILG
jgi:RTX calcium-binding nonapeptide repeat (4 copies)